ncbi:MAG: MFS transporter [Actinomycetota bacterium]
MATAARPHPDARKIYAAQGVRALAYGFGSVLLGATLEARGWSGARAGLLFAAVVSGIAVMSVVVARWGDVVGRRRFYFLLFCGFAATAVVFAFAEAFWILLIVALTGTLSTEVIESGPFTSLEQAMLPSVVPASSRARAFGTYNAIAALAGSTGALLAGGSALLRDAFGFGIADQRFFLLLVPAAAAGALIARSLTDTVEASRTTVRRAPLERSKKTVMRLSALFAADSFGGGFVIQSFVAFWFRREFDASLETLGLVFFGAGLLQTASFLAAPRIAERFGLLNTMVFTHLPSNLLLAGIAFAPSLPVGIALLLARQVLSQMDVPTRQAYIVSLVDPDERIAAASYTNVARYLTRPVGAAFAGAALRAAPGLPFLVAGGIKTIYDLALYAWFRRVPLGAGDDHAAT